MFSIFIFKNNFHFQTVGVFSFFTLSFIINFHYNNYYNLDTHINLLTSYCK